MNIPFGIPGILPLALGVYLWARWLRKRYPQARYTAALQMSAIVVPLASVSTTMVMLARGYGSMRSTSAALRATALAENITWAMRATQIALGLMVLALLLCAIYHAKLANDAWRGPPLPSDRDEPPSDYQ